MKTESFGETRSRQFIEAENQSRIEVQVDLRVEVMRLATEQLGTGREYCDYRERALEILNFINAPRNPS